MKTIKLLALILLTLIVTDTFAQVPDAPKSTFAFELRVKCSEAMSVGQYYYGKRVVIPIIGGTFEGPEIKGEILSGGADYQLVDTVRNRTSLEAIYCIKTDDGVLIHVRNRGVLKSGFGKDGKPTFYFRTVPVFEAPIDSKYAWLNDSIFLCTPYFEDGLICLKIWKVD